MKSEIINEDLLEWLENYDGERFHGVLSDPPYALISVAKRFGKKDAAPAQEGSDGRYARLSAGFMGQKWDSFRDLDHFEDWVAEWARGMMRVLYPGAVCMFFGGTRTYHRLARGLERGGFEIIDCLMWLYGSGFPKSHDISKGIDKAAGRLFGGVSVIALKKKLIELFDASGKTRKQIDDECGFRACNYLTLPSEGKRPDPWINVLPSQKKWNIIKSVINSNEDISAELDILFAEAEREIVGQQTKARKSDSGIPLPTSGETEYHTWDITIPATEVAQEWQGYGTALKPAWEPIILCRTPRGSMTFAELAKTYGTGALNIDGGRIEGKLEGDPHRFSKAYSMGNGHEGWKRPSHEIYTPPVVRSEGRWPANLLLSHHEDCVKVGEFEVEGRTINRWKEEMKPFGGGAGEEYESEEFPPDIVERWACVGECPVRALDDQAGNRPGATSPSKATPESIFRPKQGEYMPQGPIYPDTGGPARFFYTGKASRKEKDKGCEHLFWKRADGEMVLISEKEWAELPKKERAKGNIHPSVKPLDLLRYLAKLFKPPDIVKSRLLVPFSGTGSEMIAAMQAGWGEVTGVEIDENYKTIAEARIAGTMGMF